MTDIEVINLRLSDLTKAYQGIAVDVAVIRERVERIPERCEAEGAAIAVLQSQERTGAPELQRLTQSVNALEGRVGKVETGLDTRTGILGALAIAAGTLGAAIGKLWQ